MTKETNTEPTELLRLKVSLDTKRLARRLAKELNTTPSEIVRLALRKGLDELADEAQ